ncbi:hypothetical protein TrRE_jg2022 [Triparma retinervis]|uniref:WW domain-containing protein n=1 Tax=Triparma retinervis TaxID=2557542 RepID=A0A9W7ABI1_9STRA|nr:hypothetical protein TrRE_jg2022 [Triparma retinervis]
MLEDGHRMDEETTDRAFWSVVQAVDKAEAEDKPLPVEVPRMLHHIFEADHQLLRSRDQVRTNITCMQPALEGAASFGQALGYIMDDISHQDLKLKEGRKCEGGTCCEACSRNVFPTFASGPECSLATFPELASFTFNELEKTSAATILQFVRLIERVRRTMAYEYGLDLATLLPLQTYSRKYVAGTTQQGGGGGEGDYVILHTDEATHASYHYSCVLYLNTQNEEFTGGNFVFNDPLAAGEKEAKRRLEESYKNAPPMSLEEEIARARKARRDLTPFHPTTGAAVIFSSGWENMHEVEKLTSGTRYAVPSFFTTCPVPEGAYAQMAVGKPKTDEEIADDWLHLLLAHRQESPQESVGRVKELLMKWHYMTTPLRHHQAARVSQDGLEAAEPASPVVAEPAPAAQAVDAGPAPAPAPAQAPAPAPVPTAVQGDTPNPTANPYANWASAVDPASGNTYYYDTVTGETSWTWPPE